MKRAIIISAGILALFFGACKNSTNKNEQAKSTDTTSEQTVNSTQNFELDTTKLKSGETFYQCVMDREVLSDKPGSCPKCEMALSGRKKH
jgi:Heavy metal binding domain